MSTYEDLHNAVLELGDRVRAVHLFNSQPAPTDTDLEEIVQAAGYVNKLAKEFKGTKTVDAPVEVHDELHAHESSSSRGSK